MTSAHPGLGTAAPTVITFVDTFVVIAAIVAGTYLLRSRGLVGTTARLRRWLRLLVAARLPDRTYLRLRFAVTQLRPPRISQPTTHMDVMARVLLTDTNPLLTLTCDKVAMGDWAARLLGSDAVPRRFHVLDDIDLLDDPTLPPAVVIKASHGSGMTAIVTGHCASDQVRIRDPRAIRFDGPLQELDREELRTITRGWLATNHGAATREHFYRHIQPRLIIEENLGVGPDPLLELSFFMVKGEVVYVRLKMPTGPEYLLDAAFRRLVVTDRQRMDDGGVAPIQLIDGPRAVAMARVLGASFESTRVDLYQVGDRLLVGEMAHTPSAGRYWYHPRRFTRVFGAFWNGETTIPSKFYV